MDSTIKSSLAGLRNLFFLYIPNLIREAVVASIRNPAAIIISQKYPFVLSFMQPPTNELVGSRFLLRRPVV